MHDDINLLIRDLTELKVCNYRCCATVLGALMINLHNNGIDRIDWAGGIRGCSIKDLEESCTNSPTPSLTLR